MNIYTICSNPETLCSSYSIAPEDRSDAAEAAVAAAATILGEHAVSCHFRDWNGGRYTAWGRAVGSVHCSVPRAQTIELAARANDAMNAELATWAAAEGGAE